MAALDWSRDENQSIWETLIDEKFLTQVSSKLMNSIQAFTGRVEKARRDLIDGAIDSLIEAVYIEKAYQKQKT